MTKLICGGDPEKLALPKSEGFKQRAQELGKHVRLCLYCLRDNKRCGDSDRRVGFHDRSWKSYRKTQRRRGP